VNRISVHVVTPYSDRKLSGFCRDELQDLLDMKAKRDGLSFSVVDHLRGDLKQIFDMAVAEGPGRTQPGASAVHAEGSEKARSPGDDTQGGPDMFWRSGSAGRLIAKLVILAGMRPGEIFALTWGRLTATHAEIRQRVYRRKIDMPKTDNSNAVPDRKSAADC